MNSIKTRLIGVGKYLPANIVTNDDLAKRVDTSDEWIRERTGIRQRHVAAEGEYTSDLAVAAARAALANAGVEASSIDMIIVATATPDRTFPSTAVKVQAEKIPLVLPPREGALLKARFRRALLGPAADSV